MFIEVGDKALEDGLKFLHNNDNSVVITISWVADGIMISIFNTSDDTIINETLPNDMINLGEDLKIDGQTNVHLSAITEKYLTEIILNPKVSWLCGLNLLYEPTLSYELLDS